MYVLHLNAMQPTGEAFSIAYILNNLQILLKNGFY